MADVPKSTSQGLVFRQNLAGCQEPVVDLDVTADFLIFDNQVEVTYSQPTRALQRDGRVDVETTQVQLCHVRMHVIGYRDLLNGSNHLKVGDVRAELQVSELGGLVPATGDKVVQGTKVFYVFGIDYDHTAQMYIAWCRA